MSVSPIPSPKSGTGLIDEYFIENRTRLLEVAAYLDRLDRSGDSAVSGDFRMRAFREALAVLCERAAPAGEAGESGNRRADPQGGLKRFHSELHVVWTLQLVAIDVFCLSRET